MKCDIKWVPGLKRTHILHGLVVYLTVFFYFLFIISVFSFSSGAEKCIPSLCEVIHSSGETEQVTPLLQALDFTVSLKRKLSTSSCRAVGRVLGLSASSLNLTLELETISLKEARLLFRNITHLHTLRYTIYRTGSSLFVHLLQNDEFRFLGRTSSG